MTHLLVALFGYVALMLWGLHMVQRGVERSWGMEARRAFASVGGGTLRSLAIGAGATAILQSSTATILVLASWTTRRFIPLSVAIAAALGANVGTTLVAFSFGFLSIEIALALIVGGFVFFRCSQNGRLRDLGRVLIGLGIALFALHELSGVLQPLSQSPGFTLILRMATQDVVPAAIVAVLFAWLSHSSIAAVLLVASMTGAGFVSLPVAFAMVLGANVGTAINPLVHSRYAGAGAIRLAVSNLVTRLLGCLIVLPLLPLIAGWDAWAASEPSSVLGFHLLFNLAVAILLLPFVPLLARFLTRLLPERLDSADPTQPQFLDDKVVAKPVVALANAQREALRMADVVRTMLERSRGIFDSSDRARVEEIRRMDDTLDSLHEAIQRYLAAVGTQRLPKESLRRAESILSFAVSLEHIGDVVSRLLMKRASKRIKRELSFSTEGLAVIDELHVLLQNHLQLSVAAFMHEDTSAARHLAEQRHRFRRIERDITRQHFEEICSGHTEGVVAAGLFLDTIRDLRWANSRLAAAAEMAVVYRTYVPRDRTLGGSAAP